MFDFIKEKTYINSVFFRLLAFATVLAVLLVADMTRSEVRAQGDIPGVRILIFEGTVTINGELPPPDLRIFATVAGSGINRDRSARVDAQGNFGGLTIGPLPRAEGEPIVFKLADGTAGTILAESFQVVSNNSISTVQGSSSPKESTPFAQLDGNGDPDIEGWFFSQIRIVDLEFGSLPAPTPVPTPVPAGASFFSGTVRSSNYPAGVPDGVIAIEARIGDDYASPPAAVQGGQYLVLVDPGTLDFVGREVTFHVGDIVARQTTEFRGNNQEVIVNLFFEVLPDPPTPTPVPTPTPPPTPTPEPAPLPTPTPTPLPGNGGGGGSSCFGFGDGTISLGFVLMLAVPLFMARLHRRLS